jgi:hypothetical protein
MPASTFTFYQDFKEQLGKAVHNLSANVYKVALTNTAPNVATHAALADITQIATAGGYTGGAGGGVALDTVTYTETTGTGTFIAADEVITASGGAINTFQYAVIYNDTATSPADALVGYVNYGSAVNLADTESLTLDFTTSIFTVA